LSRAKDAGGFGPDDVDFARQCAVVSLAALVVQGGGPGEAEIERLNALLAESRQSEDHARQDNWLLKEIVNHLPIALTVQDAEGRFILVNDIAATNLGTPVDSLIGASPANFLSTDDAASRRDWELSLLKDGRTSTVEESVTGK